MPSTPRVALHVGATAVGFAAGLLGSFVHPLRLAGLPVGLGLGLVLSAVTFTSYGALVRRRTGAAAAALGWLAPVLLLSTPRPEGDLVVAGNPLGYAWLLGGTLLAGLCIAVPYADLLAPTAPPGPGR